MKQCPSCNQHIPHGNPKQCPGCGLTFSAEVQPIEAPKAGEVTTDDLLRAKEESMTAKPEKVEEGADKKGVSTKNK